MSEKKLRKLLRNIILEQEERKLGDCLSKKTNIGFVSIYRACDIKEFEFKDRDYVTLSQKFAVEHAENGHVYHEEPQHVIKTLVSTDNVFDAYNPGEYFYCGKNKTGKEIYVTKGDDYQGYK